MRGTAGTVLEGEREAAKEKDDGEGGGGSPPPCSAVVSTKRRPSTRREDSSTAREEQPPISVCAPRCPVHFTVKPEKANLVLTWTHHVIERNAPIAPSDVVGLELSATRRTDVELASRPDLNACPRIPCASAVSGSHFISTRSRRGASDPRHDRKLAGP